MKAGMKTMRKRVYDTMCEKVHEDDMCERVVTQVSPVHVPQTTVHGR